MSKAEAVVVLVLQVDFALAGGGGAVLASSPSVTIKEKSWLFGEWETVARLPENMLRCVALSVN